MPKLSVLMSVFNGESYLKEAIDSILNQTFTDFEFIIYDDCSTDSSISIIEQYQDSRIILIKNKQNKGLTVNLHDGMNLATGEFLARMDADDICMPDRFQKQVDYLDSHPEISILGTGVIFFDNTGKEILGTQPQTHEEIMIELLLGFTLLHPSVMMRISDMRKYRLNYDPHFRYSQDFDLWTRAGRVLKLANLYEPLIKMREHPKKISRSLKPEQKMFSDEIRKNQLEYIGLHFNALKLDIFNTFCSGINTECYSVKIYDKILIEIIDTNIFYNFNLLKKGIAKHFCNICINKLLVKDKDGLNYWNSAIRKIDNMSVRKSLGMYFRSVKSFL